MTQRRGLRLFVAVELPGEVARGLGSVQDSLRARGLGRLRWVRPEGIHVTLKFLGETVAERVPSIAGALSRATEGIAPHEVRLSTLGRFGSPRAPRVVWIDVAGEVETLLRLQKQVEEHLAALGIPPEQRAFSPHITLARVPPEIAAAVAAPLDDALASISVPELAIPVRQVSLMRSELRRDGAVYTRLDAALLG